MKLAYTKTVTKRIEVEIPDDFGWDETRRGKVADLILLNGHVSDPRRLRDQIYSDEAIKVEHAIELLTKAYATTDKILEIFNAQRSDSDSY